jgi:hypothetical protein
MLITSSLDGLLGAPIYSRDTSGQFLLEPLDVLEEITATASKCVFFFDRVEGKDLYYNFFEFYHKKREGNAVIPQLGTVQKNLDS